MWSRECIAGAMVFVKDRECNRAPMPAVGAVKVGCVLTDRGALARVASAIRREHGWSVPLTRSEVVDAAARRTIAALVYDMEPGDRTGVDLVRQVHATRPEWPTWLYYAPRATLMDVVAEVLSLRGVWATSQGTGPVHEQEIRMHARHLVTSVPRVRLLSLLDSILRPLPREARQLLEMGLARLDGGVATRFRIRNGTTGNRGALRHLERLCVRATGLGPKGLLDHLVLVFLAFKALAFDVPLERAADQMGFSPKDLHRLGHRLLGADADAAALDPRAQFEYALVALAKVCKAPRAAAEDIVQQVVRERSA